MTTLQRRFLITLLLATFPVEGFSIPQESSGLSIFTYSGAATSASLINIIKVSIPDVGSYYTTSVGASYLLTQSKYVALEVEAQLTKHYERSDLYAVGSLVVLRLLTLPWAQSVGGSFGFGSGLSYSTDFLPVETSAMGRTSKLLFHLILEYEFSLGRASSWAAFIRDHHRSGIFGVFDDVAGGSDYLCLGLRYRLP